MSANHLESVSTCNDCTTCMVLVGMGVTVNGECKDSELCTHYDSDECAPASKSMFEANFLAPESSCCDHDVTTSEMPGTGGTLDMSYDVTPGRADLGCMSAAIM